MKDRCGNPPEARNLNDVIYYDCPMLDNRKLHAPSPRTMQTLPLSNRGLFTAYLDKKLPDRVRESTSSLIAGLEGAWRRPLECTIIA